MTRCAACGVTGALGFQRVRGGQHFCPPCLSARRRKRRTQWWIFDVALVALILSFGGGSDFLALESAFLGVGLVGIVAHELGHALVGAALGFRVLTISVGAGPSLLQIRRRQWSFELHLLPVGGFVRIASPHRRAYRVRNWLVVLAGPMANVFVAWLALEMLPALGASDTVTWEAVFGQVVIAVINLLPLRVTTARGVQSSDGQQLLDIPRLTAAQIDERVAAFGEAVRTEQVRRAESDPAAVLAATHGALTADVVGISAVHHVLALANSGRMDDALSTARELLRTKPAPPEIRVNLLNAIAWWIAVLDRREDEAEAESASHEAISLAPWSAPFQGTRGAVLAWRGVDLQQAIAWLESAGKGLRQPQYRGAGDIPKMVAHDQAFLALAHVRRGDLYSGRMALQAASRGDSSFPVVSRVERLLAEAGVEPFPTHSGAVPTAT